MSDIAALADAFKTDPSGIRLRQGTIVSVQADGTATVTIGGSTVAVSGVRVDASCCPKAGAAVWIIVDEKGRIVEVLGHQTPHGPAYCELIRSATQQLLDSTYTSVAFTAENADTHGMHAANSTDIVIVVPGIYHFSGYISWPNSTVGSRTGRIVAGGATLTADKTEAFNGSHWNTMDATAKLAQGTVVTMDGLQNTGGALSISAARLTACWLGPA